MANVMAAAEMTKSAERLKTMRFYKICEDRSRLYFTWFFPLKARFSSIFAYDWVFRPLPMIGFFDHFPTGEPWKPSDGALVRVSKLIKIINNHLLPCEKTETKFSSLTQTSDNHVCIK